MPKQPEQDDEAVLREFQTGLKRKLRYLGSFLSIALIVSGLWLLANGLLGIVTSNRQNQTAITNSPAPIVSTIPYCPSPALSVLPGVAGASTSGKIEDGISTSRVQAQEATAEIKAQNTASMIRQSGKWQATDYKKGDISAGKYTVRSGDTLWEIAEAVYGQGSDWKKILNANKGSIGKLQNGIQALIKPGQVLIIPSI